MSSFSLKPFDDSVSLDFLVDFASTRKGVAVYDLETSNFRNTWNFGITEYAVLVVLPDGRKGTYSGLCNPGFPISSNASEKTGITDTMVRGAPSWEDSGGPFFSEVAERTGCLLGYNNHRFDRGCISEANEKFGWNGKMMPAESEFDIFPLTTEFFGRKTKLEDALRGCGRPVPGDKTFHRALVDVVATAILADFLIEKFGVGVFEKKCSCAGLSEKSRRNSAQAKKDNGVKTKSMKNFSTAMFPF